MLNYINQFKTPKLSQYLGVFYAGIEIGHLHQKRLSLLQSLSDLFDYHNNEIHFTASFKALSFDDKTRQLTELSQQIYQADPSLIWRNELYGIHSGDKPEKPLFAIERGIVPFFGFRAYGTHLNAYFIKENELYCWIAKRSHTKAVEPLKLDQLVAGGLSYGISPEKNLQREAWEEAGIATEFTQNVTPLHALRYCISDNDFCRHDALIAFDLSIDPNFTPHNTDGEVEDFYCIKADQLIALLNDPIPRFKPNSALIFIDFLLRHCDQLMAMLPDYSAIKKGISHHLIPFT